MATYRVQIVGDRYSWAIQRAGLSVDDYINRHPKTTVSKWISGEKQPTIKQLEDFAKSVNVPFGFLFVPTVPKEEIPFPLFRGNARIDSFNLNVYDTVVKVVQRQEWLEDYLKENDIETCPFVATMSIKNSVQEVVVALRKILNLNDTWAFGLSTSNEAVNELSNRIEDVGIFLTYNGVVGNNGRRPISVQDCRGFALVNKEAPYIFINNSDSKSAQLFTLIHELAHILVGVSAGYAGDAGYEHDYTEKFCDQVAAEFLVPSNLLTTVWNNDGIPSAAKKFKVSELVIARRARDIGLIDSEQYRMFYLQYMQRMPANKKTSGGDYYRTSVKRVGRSFAIHVRNAVNSRQLSYTEAYRLTGLYGQTYDQFMKKYI
ncbi:MAG: ImmA/IrrE family metallo-endopeptidase [Prevotellaceae bacterium]|jgi:Zn-dependent peptidase ImmA (M78 family)/transcriptional regulator with XRE-family HTH domain|nr:ImmA/IrrE family metallo-endopeptidase [Prevotellaceae bacterium]